MVFRKGGILARHEKCFYKQQRLEVNSVYKYLGVNFSTGLSWFKTQKRLANQASKAVNVLRKSTAHLKNIKPKTLVKIFDVQIAPILNYGSEVWGFHDASDIEKVQNKFFRSILGVKQCTPAVAVKAEFGRADLRFVRYEKILKYWFKLVNADSSRYISKLYAKQYELAEKGINSWGLKVKILLERLNFSEEWNSQSVTNKVIFENSLRERLSKLASDDVCDILEDYTKLTLYKTIKNVLDFENYLNVVTVKPHRIALAQFRLSSHSLMVEKGREADVPREHRYCELCVNGEIEDEYHFFCCCEPLRDLRVNTIPELVEDQSPEKMYSLLSSTDHIVLTQVAKYVFLGMKLRQRLLDER